MKKNNQPIANKAITAHVLDSEAESNAPLNAVNADLKAWEEEKKNPVYVRGYAAGRLDLGDEVEQKLAPIDLTLMHLCHLTDNSEGESVEITFKEMSVICATLSASIESIRNVIKTN